jgi:hypothetical protein
MLRLKSSVPLALALWLSLNAPVLWAQADSRPPLIIINGDAGRLLPANAQSALSVVVIDRSGNPLPNQPVLFVAPAAGATGTFLNAASADGSFFRVMTDATGGATASFVANATPEVYLVEALVEGTAASVTFAITNVTSDVTPPALAAADARAAVEQKLLFGTQLDETLRAHGPVLVPSGAVISAALPSSASVATQPYITDRQSWAFWIDEQPGFKFGHRVRFVILDAADTTADLSKARITREQFWPVVRLTADGAPNPLLPASALNEQPFQQAAAVGTSNRTSQLRSTQPAAVSTPRTCVVVVRGPASGGVADIGLVQDFLVGSGRVPAGNVFAQGSGRNAPATRQDLAGLLLSAEQQSCKIVYLYISAHGTSDGSVVLMNGTTGESDPVNVLDLQTLLAPLTGIQIYSIIDAGYSGKTAPAFQGIGLTGTFVSSSDAHHTASARTDHFTPALIKCWKDPKSRSTGDGMVTLDDAKTCVDTNASKIVTAARPQSAPINPNNIVVPIPDVILDAGGQGSIVIPRSPALPLDSRIKGTLVLPDTKTATLGLSKQKALPVDLLPGAASTTVLVTGVADGQVQAFFDGSDPSNPVTVSGSGLISVGGPFAPVHNPPLIPPGSTSAIQLFRFQGFEQTERPVTIQVIPQDPTTAVPAPDLLTFDPYQAYVDLQVQAKQPGHTSFNILDSFFAYQPTFQFDVGSPTLTGINPPPTISDGPLTYTVNGTFLLDIDATLIKIDTATTVVPAHDVTSSSFQFDFQFRLPGAIDLSAHNLEGLISNTLREPVQLPAATVVNDVGPSTFPASSTVRTFKVTGTGFVPGDRVLLDFFDVTVTPQGEAQVNYVDKTTLMVNASVPKLGKYLLYVVDPFGQSSNKFLLTATPLVPNLTRIDPSNPPVGGFHLLTFTGSDFDQNVSVGVLPPDGRGFGVSGAQIMNASSTRFDALIPLSIEGEYRAQAIDQSGQASNVVSFTVGGQAQGQGPVISTINPADLSASSIPRWVTLIGKNFKKGVSLLVVAPGGAGTTFKGDQVQFIGPEIIQVQLALVDSGNYSLTAFNDDGLSSNVFAFFVTTAASAAQLILSCPAASADVNMFYHSALVATGGVAAYGYAIIAGFLPAEFTVDGWTGNITGTPRSAGTFAFTAKVTDSKGSSAIANCTITDRAPPATCTCPPSSMGKVGEPYSSPVGSAGGVPPKTFSISSGSLPGGLILNSSNGAISGTPNASGTSNFTVMAMDSTGTTAGTATANCAITIVSSNACTRGSDCGSGVCTSGMCQAPTCSDGVKNGMETDVDCGGGTCPVCPAGKSCSAGRDCQSMVCNGGMCQMPSCSDGVKNGMETDVDCGGPNCRKCGNGGMCNGNGDCGSNFCNGGVCQSMPAPTCTDGVKNGNETDVDCGGGTCPACPAGKSCSAGRDCQSMVCNGGMCQMPSCSDGVKNGMETDVDCGGTNCRKCGNGGMCNGNGDCGSNFCNGGVCQPMPAPSCTDGMKNGNETDVDCGGTCPACPAGKSCSAGRDCQSMVCNGGRCQPPSCSDGVRNGTETDVDCGGTCPTCPSGRMCSRGSDCQSRVCTGGMCQAPSCTDGIRNGTETDVDCGGGSCPKCGMGSMCNGNGDCGSGFCNGGVCQPMPAATCNDGMKNGNETDVDCGGGTCPACTAGKSCSAGRDCQSMVCTGGRCQAPSCSDGVRNGNETDVDCGGTCPACQSGRMCKANIDCISGFCNNGVCQASPQMPVITAVRGPQRASPSPQHVMASGNNFQPGTGFRVILIFPNNSGGITLTGTQIQNETPISFEFDAVFQTPGDYMLRVQNQFGGPSDAFIVKIAPPL